MPFFHVDEPVCLSREHKQRAVGTLSYMFAYRQFRFAPLSGNVSATPLVPDSSVLRFHKPGLLVVASPKQCVDHRFNLWP